MNAIEKMINYMVLNKIYRKDLTIKSGTNVSLFLSDSGPYVANKQIRLYVCQDHISIYLGPESMKLV
jgi:hypothetical protein